MLFTYKNIFSDFFSVFKENFSSLKIVNVVFEINSSFNSFFSVQIRI